MNSLLVVVAVVSTATQWTLHGRDSVSTKVAHLLHKASRLSLFLLSPDSTGFLGVPDKNKPPWHSPEKKKGGRQAKVIACGLIPSA